MGGDATPAPGTLIDPTHAAGLAERIVQEAIHRSVQLTPDEPPIVPQSVGSDEPVENLRRADGASVFTVAGTTQYTSARILDAEQRILAVAGQPRGSILTSVGVDRHLAEAAARGTVLDEGQAAMVRTLGTGEQWLQLAIAPAGAGKTTALKVLADAWIAAGGNVLGLAPSAAAAAQLAEETGVQTDTLARLTWAIQHQQPLLDWAAQIKPSTLLLVDEAGMADTLTLDTAITFARSRYARIGLIGDDRQLGAVGAGGILTDLAAVHGAVRLTQLHRFHDPAEASATLRVRDGDLAALDFYAQHDRITVADHVSLPDRVVAAWRHDTDQGLETIMLAARRDQVADLNARARTTRHTGEPPGREVALADGNHGSVGDLIITRRNDRRLGSRPGGTSWVRNGDRWTITALIDRGDIEATHQRTGHAVVLPAGYVQDYVELGYATTIHAAQGVTADTSHSLISPIVGREQLYTMISRGRTHNQIYLPMGEASALDPRHILQTDPVGTAPVQLLRKILARTEQSTSATSAHTRHAGSAAPWDPEHHRYEPTPTRAPSRAIGPSW